MHFLRQYSEQYCKLVDCVEPGAMTLLAGLFVAGNVRELENVIQRAIIVAKDISISVADRPANIREEEHRVRTARPHQPLRTPSVYFKLKLASEAIRENDGITLAARSCMIFPGIFAPPDPAHGPSFEDETLLPQEQPIGLVQCEQ